MSLQGRVKSKCGCMVYPSNGEIQLNYCIFKLWVDKQNTKNIQYELISRE